MPPGQRVVDSPDMRAPRTQFALLIGLALAVAACGKHDPLDEPVDARNPDVYQLYFGRLTEDLSPADVARFQAAEKDIKLDVMAHAQGLGEQAVAEGFCAKINGLTARQIIRLGLRDRIDRIRLDLAESQRLLTANSAIGGADDESRAVVADRVAEDRRRVDRDTTALNEAQADLDRLDAPAGP